MRTALRERIKATKALIASVASSMVIPTNPLRAQTDQSDSANVGFVEMVSASPATLLKPMLIIFMPIVILVFVACVHAEKKYAYTPQSPERNRGSMYAEYSTAYAKMIKAHDSVVDLLFLLEGSADSGASGKLGDWAYAAEIHANTCPLHNQRVEYYQGSHDLADYKADIYEHMGLVFHLDQATEKMESVLRFVESLRGVEDQVGFSLDWAKIAPTQMDEAA